MTAPPPADPVVLTGVGLALPGIADAAALPGATRTAVRAAGPVEPADRLGRRGLRYLDRAGQLALCAARDALRDAALLPADGDELAVPGESVAVVASSNLGSLGTVCELAATIAERTTDLVSPMALPNASSNVVAAAVAMRFGLRGPNLMFTNGPTSGLDAVFWAALLVTSGRCATPWWSARSPATPWSAGCSAGRPASCSTARRRSCGAGRDGGRRGAPRLAELGRTPAAPASPPASTGCSRARRALPASGSPTGPTAPGAGRPGSPGTTWPTPSGRPPARSGSCSAPRRSAGSPPPARPAPPPCSPPGTDTDDAVAGLLLRSGRAPR